MTGLPPGWTVTHEPRPHSLFDADPKSAFGDGMQWVVRDPAGQRPAQAEWPTSWHDQAVAYAHSVAAHRAAELAGEPSPPYAPSPANESLLTAPAPVRPVLPSEWDGPPHLRPGLFMTPARFAALRPDLPPPPPKTKGKSAKPSR